MLSFAKKGEIFIILAVFILAIFFFNQSLIGRFIKNINNFGLFGANLSQLPDSSLQTEDLQNNEKEIEEENSQVIAVPELAKASELADEITSEAIESDLNLVKQKSVQDQIDDISEKIDLIKTQVYELVESLKVNVEDSNVPEILQLAEAESENQNQDNNQIESENVAENNSGAELAAAVVVSAAPAAAAAGRGGGGSNPIIYPKILISEIQTSGLSDEKEEFVELYNPNSEETNLTGWYLQRKTETGSEYSSFVSKTLFEGKKIGPKEYFLIARQESSFSGLADLITDNSLGDSNSSGSLALKNPNREVSDLLGFGQAQNYETFSAQSPEAGKSLGRRWVQDSEQDTDSNSADFEIQIPTPKAQNIAFVEPQIPETPKDIAPPEIIFGPLSETQTSLNFTIDFEIMDLSEIASPSGVSGFVFRWKEEGGDWQQDLPAEVSGSPSSANLTRDFIGEDQKTYYFQAKAKDLAENESDWQPAEPIFTKIELPKPVETKPVLINEIQMAPIEQRFVELYNLNNFDIDLTGWYLQRKTKTADSWSSFVSSTNFEGKIITANGYFLISRELLNSDIFLDITLSDNNSLALKNPNREIIDEVGWGLAQDFEGNLAPTPPETKSITRTTGADTNDNSVDFIIFDTPTPKAE